MRGSKSDFVLLGWMKVSRYALCGFKVAIAKDLVEMVPELEGLEQVVLDWVLVGERQQEPEPSVEVEVLESTLAIDSSPSP